jgi:hypothetical protein
MDTVSRAKALLSSLPRDEESDERALAFRSLVKQTSESQDALVLLRQVYKLAGDGEWSPSLHDSAMLVFGLEDNVWLLTLVREDVERWLSKLPYTCGMREDWIWLQTKTMRSATLSA